MGYKVIDTDISMVLSKAFMSPPCHFSIMSWCPYQIFNILVQYCQTKIGSTTEYNRPTQNKYVEVVKLVLFGIPELVLLTRLTYIEPN